MVNVCSIKPVIQRKTYESDYSDASDIEEQRRTAKKLSKVGTIRVNSAKKNAPIKLEEIKMEPAEPK